MSHFPHPIQLPHSVFLERQERQKQLLNSATIGICIRLAIIILELIGGFLFNSSALLMDALASFLDVLSSISLVISIKMAGRPPDEKHPFGHGRYEPLMGLQLGLLLVFVGIGMFIHQVAHLTTESNVPSLNSHTWIFPFVALILLELSYRIVSRAAKIRHSPALAADAYHYRIDGLASLFATIALALGAFFPSWSILFDHVGALFIAGLMIGLGAFATKSNLNQLMDHIPNRSFFERVRKAALFVEGVKETEKIRIQFYGPDAHVDIDIEVDPHLTVEIAHEISQKVRAEIQKDWSAVRDVTVHIEPYYPNDHQKGFVC